jgi:hypothetical protein
METPIVEEVIERLKGLPPELQRRVLEFTRSLAKSSPRGVPGRRLVSFCGSIKPDDLRLMSQAIEDGCERVDANEW